MNLKDKSPLELGKMLCDSLMHTYEPQKLPPEGVLFYWQGVFLNGMERIYKKCGDKKYFNYIKDYADSVIGPSGELYGFCHELTTKDTPHLAKLALTMLDNKQATLVLYNLFDETGDEKYITAAKSAAQSMYYWPVNSLGGYWHMMTQHHQMWLDGAYMAGPISVIYAKRFGDTVLRERAIKQIFIMDDFMKDEKTGLYFHGWDESKEMEWADSETGLSSHIWGRALGWYTVAILDILEYIPKDHPAVERLSQIERDLLRALKKYQDKKTGMWYQVTDKPEMPDNWVESSCTNLFIYSYAKAIRTGVILKEEFGETLEKAYNGIKDRLYLDDDGYLVVDNVCEGTCIESGTYEHYINRKKISNDLHGAGAFILMCSEMDSYYKAIMITIKDRFEISDSEYHYSAGYYTQNKWIDNDTFVACRSKEAHAHYNELVKISLETGEKTLLCNDVIGSASYVVHENFVYYTNGRELKQIDANTGKITVIYEDEFYSGNKNVHMEMPEKTNDGKFLSAFYIESGVKTLYAVIDVEKGTAKKLCEKIFAEPFDVANHGMICPTDPRIIFFAHEGDTRYVSNRLWIYDDRTGQMYNLAKQNLDINGNLADCFGHECWAPHGEGMYFVKYPVSPVPPKGICYVDLKTRETSLLYSGFPYWHVGVSHDNRFLLADTVIDYTESDVIVVDQSDGTETKIDNVRVDNHPRHPHPQMSPDDKTVIYTAIDEEGKTVVNGTRLEISK